MGEYAKLYPDIASKSLSISLYTPPPLRNRLKLCKDLMPDRTALSEYKRTDDLSQFIDSFSKQLAGLDVEKMYEKLDGKLLLCYERPESFCHRHLIRMWFILNGYECEELPYQTDDEADEETLDF